MTIEFTAPVIANFDNLLGNQQVPMVVGLATGGYVVAWNNQGLTVEFQRYDASGNKVGSQTTVGNSGTVLSNLQDIVATDDGNFTILTQSYLSPGSFNDLRYAVQSFSGLTGASTAPATLLNPIILGPNGSNGAQLVADQTRPDAVVLTGVVYDAAFNSDMVRATISTSGVVLQPLTAVLQSVSVGTVLESVPSPGGFEFVLQTNSITGSNGFGVFGGTYADIANLDSGDGMVLAQRFASNPNVVLSTLIGTSSNLSDYALTGGTVATAITGQTTAGAQVFDVEVLDLGQGRLLMVWVADGGDSTVANGMTDGVYAQVYNMNTGGPEGAATLIRDFGQGSNDSTLQSVNISADKMADGRVAVGISFANGLSFFDVFHTILDPRSGGVTLAANPTLGEALVGTAFADTFTGVGTGDTIIGGAGIDTVVLDNTARSVDLQTPEAFPSSGVTLSGIENVTGGSASDLLRGDGLANLLNGGASADTLAGRDGNDTLIGGTNNDLLMGGNGNDQASGDSGNDTLQGNAGNDLLFGGTEGDRLLGGSGDDNLNGGDADDRLLGDAGADVLAGDAGNDVLIGGAGDDELNGGAGNDTLRAEDGADQAFGGAENDTIYIDAGTILVDGGAGFDTLRLTGTPNPGTVGYIVDLTGVFDQLGTSNSLTRINADLAGIETVVGDVGNDFLIGDSGANQLRGGAGNDTLVSGSGADTLLGGSGVDVFVFAGTNGSADTLSDISLGTDKIGLVDGTYGDISAANIATRLTVNATATVGATAVAQFVFDNSGAGFGQLFYDADGNGAAAAVLLATLVPTTGTLVALTATDFTFL